ncbi:hypothetical protein CBR71_19520 [Bordetella hinzii]|nr:hypothetical protein CBR70_19260 [Bordetella hinzii]QDJ47841.1 hypothetical protein CBR71_19520 [Bordetella hinzii]QWF38722.1 FCD domain-containing protein [Bordetella hinzii]QWF43266.1 FCD domain-containing protein [Bordetella hinzii]QWF47807.1 FCD domain-containing protein [Bordetella hinzii]
MLGLRPVKDNRLVCRSCVHGVHGFAVGRSEPAGRGQRVQKEHERIFEAIRDQQPEEARDATREHIYNSRMRTLDASFSPNAAPDWAAGRLRHAATSRAVDPGRAPSQYA